MLDEAKSKIMLPDTKSMRVLCDFTGDAYRLIMETAYDSLSDYEKSLSGSMNEKEWQQWYERFKPNVNSSHREILKLIMWFFGSIGSLKIESL